jgi:hypothetical protein
VKWTNCVHDSDAWALNLIPNAQVSPCADCQESLVVSLAGPSRFFQTKNHTTEHSSTFWILHKERSTAINAFIVGKWISPN